MYRRTIGLGVALAAAFNLGLMVVFGINFAQFVLVYLPLIPVAVSVPRYLKPTLAVVVAAAVATVMCPRGLQRSESPRV